MTVYKKHQKKLAQAKEVYLQQIKDLEDALHIAQDLCKHKWSKEEPEMFYAMGNTAPGKQCKECGLQKHV